MESNQSAKRTVARLSIRCPAWLPFAASLAACGAPARFPERPVMTVDQDEAPFVKAPHAYESPFLWDVVNSSTLLPLARFLAVDPAGRAVNVNAYDEVPDSSWFVNRRPEIPASSDGEIRGPCENDGLDVEDPAQRWTVLGVKESGSNPGLRIEVTGIGHFLVKVDTPEDPDRGTGAAAVASRLYHALGYFTPCERVVYFRPTVLDLAPRRMASEEEWLRTDFDRAAVLRVLARATKQGERIRASLSTWIQGTSLGPYRYEGKRKDDPNDVVNHEDRRELRGARLLAAWTNHFDCSERNTLDVFVPKAPGPRGFVRHYSIDLGDAFGGLTASDTKPWSPRANRASTNGAMAIPAARAVPRSLC